MFDLAIPEGARSFYDPHKTMEWMKETAISALSDKLNKIETNDYKLKVSGVKLKDAKKRFTLAEQKNAILEKRDLTLPIVGTVELIDKRSGNVVDKKDTTLAHLPYLTERNTTVYNGSEYVTTSQQRLKPGVYTRMKETGEVEAHVNPRTGTGMMAKLIFDPHKATFVYQLGTTGIKIYGLLKDLGVSDDEMRKAWGEEIFLKNKATYDGKEVDKAFEKVFTF